MKYFSMFSGIGGFEKGIHSVFKDTECVGYSEINPYSIKVYENHFPSHKNFGDITQVKIKDIPDFDILFGGSPCQNFSTVNWRTREGLDGQKSKLFYYFVEILKIKKPKYFILENVASMGTKDKDVITNILGVQPVMLDARHFSAQKRRRLFWCNFPIQNVDTDRKNITFKDILEKTGESDITLLDKVSNKLDVSLIKDFNKCPAITQAYSRKGNSREYLSVVYMIHKLIGESRNITIKEVEQLQSFPINWTEGISSTRRYEALGNAVNVEVVKYIFQQLKKGSKSNKFFKEKLLCGHYMDI